MKNILFLFVFSVITLTSCAQNDKNLILEVANYKEVVVGKDVQLVDVRTPKEYQAGFIDNAINIDFMNQKTFKEGFENLDRNKPLYIYCRSGNRSQKSVALLEAMGFKEIYDLKGGYNAWVVQ